MFRIEHNVETGEIAKIELTVEEIAAYKKDEQEFQIVLEERLKEENAKTKARQIVLDRLGINAEEAALLS